MSSMIRTFCAGPYLNWRCVTIIVTARSRAHCAPIVSSCIHESSLFPIPLSDFDTTTPSAEPEAFERSRCGRMGHSLVWQTESSCHDLRPACETRSFCVRTKLTNLALATSFS
jgi:hypothetical protein